MKNFRLNLIFRILVLTFSIFLLSFLYFKTELFATLIILTVIIAIQVFSLIRFIDTTNKELTRFLQSIKHSDFSQSFIRQKPGSTFEELNSAFNEVINEFQKTRSEKEEHFRFVQTVIQHVGVGLILFNQEGKVELINNVSKKMLKITFLNNIFALNKANPGLGDKFFNIKVGEKSAIKIADENEILQLITYATEFRMKNKHYTLLSLQNIQPELEEKEMEAWQKLIRVLTHEIMNSITPISSLASTINKMIEKDKMNEGEIKDIKIAVDTIKKRSDGLIHFVDNYRSLTHIPVPEFQIFQVKNLFKRIEKLFENDLKVKNIKLTTFIEPEMLELTADPDLIEHVIINLINNSIYFLNGIEETEIKLIGQIDGRGKTVIKVSDNGIGIKEDLQEKIFIPFFSTKKNGSGIGLSISKQIIRSHGGSIRAYSNPGKDTTFTLTF